MHSGMTGLELAKKFGGPTELSKLIGISRQMIYRWRRIPAEKALAIEKATGVPKEQLRSDLWPPRKARK